MREEQWRRVTDKVITIEQANAVTTIQASTRERLALTTSNFKMSNVKVAYFYGIVLFPRVCCFLRGYDAFMWTA